jgi:hypothetical protein
MSVRALLLPLLLTPSLASASVLLSLDFDDPADPFRDDSLRHNVLTNETFTEEWTGMGVMLDGGAGGSPEGSAAYFDGGSALSFVGAPEMAWDPSTGVTVRFLFRSPGTFRPTLGQYAPRMHAMGFGSGGDNWDVDLDDIDASSGLWTYWSGTGGNATLSTNTMGLYTDDTWYEYYWTWDGQTASSWIRPVTGGWTLVDTFAWSGTINGAGLINYIGHSSYIGANNLFGFVGWIDGVRIADGSRAPDLCPLTPAYDTADFDEDGIGDACEAEIYVDIVGSCPAGNNVQIAHLTPGGSFAIVRSAAPGAITVPSGPCAGTTVPLAAPASLITTVTAPPGGQLNRAVTLGAGWCGKYVSVVDMSTCRVSPPVLVP